MPINSWGSTKQWYNTFASGGHFEESVSSLIHRYTADVWSNVRIETLLTVKGNTELDIIFCLGGMVYILELKRVRKIQGNYSDPRWTMFGWNSNDDTGKYVIPNVIEQNNIHMRSFVDLFYSSFRCWPPVVPIIIVPDGCEYSPSLRRDIFTVSELDNYLRGCNTTQDKTTVFRMAYLLGGGSPILQRPDFVQRHTELRGRK